MVRSLTAVDQVNWYKDMRRLVFNKDFAKRGVFIMHLDYQVIIHNVILNPRERLYAYPEQGCFYMYEDDLIVFFVSRDTEHCMAINLTTGRHRGAWPTRHIPPVFPMQNI